ncbi:zinc ribbon domain-containing protein [Methanobrevibacter sp.]|uniref:zinc ribbon domain-containing protein n=1 Tax=Methanobrevibacter sp. TaxID=66852 RepID=UPI0026007CDC|nr:zinc ribbon domain-containing protein [Methanobrevibacter sp.]MBQ6511321.1 zinc ribbon domain-containing protein [Methanobrevibacter sp.]
MANFCTNCGTKLGKDDNFCGNCGTKINKSDIKQNNTLSGKVKDIIEKKAKEIEEENNKLKTIDKIFESDEIKSEIRKNKIEQMHVISIKNSLKNKIINKRENMSDDEIKHFIKTELKKAIKEQEKVRITKEKEMKRKENEMTNGGYCNYNCKHFYEEFLDSGGMIVGDFDSEGVVDYYCTLGHSVAIGKFCKDYE